jgi:hypothetical protein
MKKAYIFTLILALSTLTSCNTSYDDYEEDRGSTIGFTLGATLELPVSSTNPIVDFPIPCFVTNASNIERTFEVIVVQEETDVAAENYSFNAMVTIPANERKGTLYFTAMNVSLTSEYQPLIIAFKADENTVSGRRASIALRSNN